MNRNFDWAISHACINYMYIYVYVCVCVRERYTDRQIGSKVGVGGVEGRNLDQQYLLLPHSPVGFVSRNTFRG